MGSGTGPVVVTANGAPSAGVNFIVTPTITSLNPNSGFIGTQVTITGTGFGSLQGSSIVTFNGTSATPTSWNDTSIVVPVPAGATSGNVVVTVGASTASASFTVTAGPLITSLTSTSGVTGSLVGINGSGFGAEQGSSVVRFHGTAAQVCTSSCSVCSGGAGWSNSCIAATVPSSATSGPVSVTVSGQAATGPQFTVTGAGTGQISGSATCSGTATVTVQALRQGVVQGSTTTTCNTGSYTISSLAANSYDVQASASGVGTATQIAVPVAIGATTSGINFSLTSAGTITGSITKASGGAAINGATVQVFVGSALVSSVNTGGTNSYSIGGLSAGTYRVQASAPSLVPPVVAQSQSVILGAGATVTQNFALQALGATPITYSYDNLGRLIGVTDQSGDTATYNYDAVGNITSIGRRSSSLVSLISIEPLSGHVGDTVTLTGTGFSTTASQNTVQFIGGNTLASSSTPTQIVTTVAAAASNGARSAHLKWTARNNVPFLHLAGAGGAPNNQINSLLFYSRKRLTAISQ